jgi:hypothetical protein
VKATRRTQPYRKGARQPGAALMAMLRGRSLTGYNPADITRMASSRARARPERRARPPRRR